MELRDDVVQHSPTIASASATSSQQGPSQTSEPSGPPASVRAPTTAAEGRSLQSYRMLPGILHCHIERRDRRRASELEHDLQAKRVIGLSLALIGCILCFLLGVAGIQRLGYRLPILSVSPKQRFLPGSCSRDLVILFRHEPKRWL